MIETTVESIRVSLVTQNRVVILREVDGERHLPIWIGAYEAEAIAMELQGVTATRPLPYDLIRTLIGELKVSVQQVLITTLSDQVFYARIILDHSGNTVELDARPSDAIAIAVRTGARILVSEEIMEQVGVAMDSDDDEIETEQVSSDAAGSPPDEESIRDKDSSEPASEQLGVFRDFINSLDLDDFDRKRTN